MVDYTIKTIKNYPDNGKHQEVVWELPFEIRKGEDGYCYYENGKEYRYNMGLEVTTKWIVHLKNGANPSLRKMFKITVKRDLNNIIKYCIGLYMKSLDLEIKRLQKEKEKYNNLKG